MLVVQIRILRHLSRVRYFASSTTTPVKAPIQIFGLEGRYAHALFAASAKQNKQKQVENDISKVNSLIVKDESFRNFLFDPTLERKEKQAEIANILKKMNFDEMTLNFFELLAENNRLPKVTQIINSFERLMSASRGEVSCVVTTAKKLDDNSTKSLHTSLKGFLQPGESLNIETKVDETILGGMIVEIKDKYIDISTATKIRRISNLLKQAI